jgi:hypothetical protein
MWKVIIKYFAIITFSALTLWKVSGWVTKLENNIALQSKVINQSKSKIDSSIVLLKKYDNLINIVNRLVMSVDELKLGQDNIIFKLEDHFAKDSSVTKKDFIDFQREFREADREFEKKKRGY